MVKIKMYREECARAGERPHPPSGSFIQLLIEVGQNSGTRVPVTDCRQVRKMSQVGHIGVVATRVHKDGRAYQIHQKIPDGTTMVKLNKNIILHRLPSCLCSSF